MKKKNPRRQAVASRIRFVDSLLVRDEVLHAHDPERTCAGHQVREEVCHWDGLYAWDIGASRNEEVTGDRSQVFLSPVTCHLSPLEPCSDISHHDVEPGRDEQLLLIVRRIVISVRDAIDVPGLQLFFFFESCELA